MQRQRLIKWDAVMSEGEIKFEQVLALAQQLSLSDQARLINHLSSRLEIELKGLKPHTQPSRRSLHGILADLGPAPSAEDIDEVRREMWDNFPRDDF